MFEMSINITHNTADPGGCAVEGVGSAAARLLGLRVRTPPAICMSVSCACRMCCQLRSLCDGPITRPKESYRVSCVWVWCSKPHRRKDRGPKQLSSHDKKYILIKNINTRCFLYKSEFTFSSTVRDTETALLLRLRTDGSNYFCSMPSYWPL